MDLFKRIRLEYGHSSCRFLPCRACFRKTSFIFVTSMILILLFLRMISTSSKASVSNKLRFIEPEGTSDMHMFIFSAHYVQDVDTDHPTSMIRMNVIGEVGISNANLFCEVEGELTKASLRQVEGSTELCSYGNFFLDCPVRKALSRLALIDANNKAHQVVVTEADTTPRTLVVCFSRLFLFEKWEVLLASLELYDFFGADLMVLQIISVIDKLYPILKAYEEAGRIRLKAAPKIPQFPDISYDPNVEVAWLNLVASHTDCLYDYRESAKFILNVDVDDILIPRKFDNLKQELLHLSNLYPAASSFEFVWTTVTAHKASRPEMFTISNLMEYNYSNETANHGKSAVIPKRVDHFRSPQLNGQERVKLTEEDMIILHFRDLSDKTPIPKNDSYFATSSIDYKAVDSKLHSFMRSQARKAFLSLPRLPQYSTVLDNCYRRVNEELKNGTLTKCPNPLSCEFHDLNPNTIPSCTIPQYRYEHTQMTSGLRVSSIIESEFKQNVNCLSS